MVAFADYYCSSGPGHFTRFCPKFSSCSFYLHGFLSFMEEVKENKKRFKLVGLGKNLLLLLFTLVFIFVSLEIGIRFISPQYRKIVHYDAVVGMTRIPSSTFTYSRIADGQRIKHPVNSDGFIGPDYLVQKGNNIFRIVILGDSYTEGIQVDDKYAFRNLLENKLREFSKKEIEVINLSMSGYSTAQEYLALNKFGLKYQPDLVILVFNPLNDVSDNSFNLWGNSSKPFFEVREGKLNQIVWPKPFSKNYFFSLITDYFVSPRFIYDQYQQAKASLRYQVENSILEVDDSVYDVEYLKEWEEAWEITKYLITATAEEAMNNSSKFLFVSIPDRSQVIAELKQNLINLKNNFGQKIDFEKPDNILEPFLTENKISHLFMLTDFTNQADNQQLYLKGDGHFSEKGHQLAADLIYKYSIDNNLVPQE